MKKMEPLISIVIPTHNRADLLPRALTSALKQTYSNIEIVVVSDGSEDSTDEVMEKYKSENPRIKYISYHPAKGGNVARNIGITESSGEYVAFLDDDDEWYCDKIQKQWNMFRDDDNIGLVCTGINSIQEGENFTTKFIPPAKYDSSKYILLRNCIGSTTTVMVKKELLKKSGMFDENLKALQDYDLWVRLCQITKVGVVKEPCVDYYNYKSSGQVSSFTEKYEEAVLYLDDKYKDLISSLPEQQRKERKIYFSLLLAKKAIRNGTPKLARKYIKEASSVKLTKDIVICWFASFFSVGFVNKIKSVVRAIKHKK